MLKLVDQIKQDEDFRGMPYKDTKGNLTIGFGTLLPLSRVEAEWLLTHRLGLIKEEMSLKCKIFDNLPGDAQEILLNMGYNMGVPKLCGFKKMWKALANYDFDKASKEMLDSEWAREVKSRAINLAKQMKEI